MSSSHKKIGLVTWDYDPPKGGMGWSLQWIVQALRGAGKEVIVSSDLVVRSFGHIFFSLLLPFSLPRWLVTHSIRQLIVPVGPGGVFLLFKPKVEVTAIVYHTYEQQSRLVPGQWWKKIFIPCEARTLRMASSILCFCEDTKVELMNRYGIAEEKIRFLHHALDLDAWSSSQQEEKGLCVCVARLEKRKGVEKIVEAWPAVIKEMPNARLVIVGDGIGAASIDAEIAGMKNVERSERLPFSDFRKLVGRAEIALCPSYLEGYGLAAAEAMAAGTCVIAFDSEGLRSMIKHGETGVLVPTGDVDVLSSAIIDLLRDDARRTHLSHNAQLFIREFCDPASANAALATSV